MVDDILAELYGNPHNHGLLYYMDCALPYLTSDTGPKTANIVLNVGYSTLTSLGQQKQYVFRYLYLNKGLSN